MTGAFRLDFVSVGPQRTGTTWMYQYLLGHPGVFVSQKVKESFYFDREFARGAEWYQRLFEGRPPGVVVGELAPTYFHSAEAPERLVAHSPGCQVIVTLREPVERMVSLYRHLLRIGSIPKATSFERALVVAPELVETSRYAHHLRRWTGAFGSQRTDTLLFDELAADPQAFAAHLCRVLGIELHEVTDDLRVAVNTGAEARVPAVSHALDRLAAGARRLGLHALVNRVRGARRVLERPAVEAGIPAFAASAGGVLSDLVRSDGAALRSEFGIDTAAWEQRWASLGI